MLIPILLTVAILAVGTIPFLLERRNRPRSSESEALRSERLQGMSTSMTDGHQPRATGATKMDELLLRTDECKMCNGTFRKSDMFQTGRFRYCFPCIEKAFKRGYRVGDGYIPRLPLFLIGVFVLGGGLSTLLGISMQYRALLALAVGYTLAALGSSIPVSKVLGPSGDDAKLDLERAIQLVKKEACGDISEAEREELWTVCTCPTEVHMLRDLAVPESRGAAFTWVRPQGAAHSGVRLEQHPQADAKAEASASRSRSHATGTEMAAAPVSLTPPKKMSDGSVCNHEGETSNYCTRCWAYLKPYDR